MRALMLPGRAYSVEMPLLHFARLSLLELGYDVVPLEWDDDAPSQATAMEPWVRRQVESCASTSGPFDLVVAKSRGTLAAAWAAERSVAAVWLTPLLTDADLVAALRANPAPQLLVGGTADDLWDAGEASALMAHGCRVHEIPGADHALADTSARPGSAVRTAEQHADVARVVHGFVGSLA